MQNLLSLKNIRSDDLHDLFSYIARAEYPTLQDVILGTAFFQSSTRTRLSFEIAMSRLRGRSVGFSDRHASRCFDNYFQETQDDFARVMAEMVNVLVVRHFRDFAPMQMAAIIDIPVINAGDGTNEHPTQALQDIWLMQQKLGSLEGKVIGFLGDISRNHRSISFALRHFNVMKQLYLLPPKVSLPEDIRLYLNQHCVDYECVDDLSVLLKNCDAINSFTSSMKDLENKKTGLNYVHIHRDYIIDRAMYEKINSHALILNAGPRTYEVSTDMDNHPNFLFFEQVKVGIQVRMGIISYLMRASHVKKVRSQVSPKIQVLRRCKYGV